MIKFIAPSDSCCSSIYSIKPCAKSDLPGIHFHNNKEISICSSSESLSDFMDFIYFSTSAILWLSNFFKYLNIAVSDIVFLT